MRGRLVSDGFKARPPASALKSLSGSSSMRNFAELGCAFRGAGGDWSRQQELNPQPSDYKSAALPIAPCRLMLAFGCALRGFEPLPVMASNRSNLPLANGIIKSACENKRRPCNGSPELAGVQWWPALISARVYRLSDLCAVSASACAFTTPQILAQPPSPSTPPHPIYEIAQIFTFLCRFPHGYKENIDSGT